MSWIRILIGAASLAAAGAAAARRVAKRAVDDHKRALLDQAEREARRRIRAEGAAFERRMLRRFLIGSAVKAALLLGLFALLFFGAIPPWAFAWAAGSMVAAFMLRDLYLTYPDLRIAATQLQKHGWSPHEALGEAVAARALAAALEQAQTAELGWREKVALALAGADQGGLGRELAASVAEIARSMAWPELRPYARSTAVKLLGGSALYAVFAAAVLAAARAPALTGG